jgi:hypothetical protein
LESFGSDFGRPKRIIDLLPNFQNLFILTRTLPKNVWKVLEVILEDHRRSSIYFQTSKTYLF